MNKIVYFLCFGQIVTKGETKSGKDVGVICKVEVLHCKAWFYAEKIYQISEKICIK